MSTPVYSEITQATRSSTGYYARATYNHARAIRRYVASEGATDAILGGTCGRSYHCYVRPVVSVHKYGVS